MTELKPCPCCGSTKIHVVAPDDGCYCWDCGLTMPKRPNWRERWNRRAEEEQNTHIEHTVNISTGSITKEELDRYLWERSADILLPYHPCEDAPDILFDEAFSRTVREAVKKCLEEYYREKEGKE